MPEQKLIPFYMPQMAKNTFNKLSTMVGENFEIYMSQMAKNALKLSTMVGEMFKIYLSQMAKNALKLSTMVGENFEIYLSQMAKNALKFSTMLEKIKQIFELMGATQFSRIFQTKKWKIINFPDFSRKSGKS